MQEIEQILNMIVDNGIGVFCVGYLIYFQSTTMQKMLNTLNVMSERLTGIETRIEEYHGNK
jgi:hypothetical protein